MPFRNLEVTSAAESEDASKKLLAMCVDGIKVHLQPPPPPEPPFPRDGIQAAVTLAHEVKKPVFVHPNSGADVIAAIEAGVDVIAHTTPQSGPWDGSLAAEMKDRKVALTPTLAACGNRPCAMIVSQCRIASRPLPSGNYSFGCLQGERSFSEPTSAPSTA